VPLAPGVAGKPLAPAMPGTPSAAAPPFDAWDEAADGA
jgi:hypothetical protein